MHNGHFWHQEEQNKLASRPRRKYSLFGKVHNQWKRVSPITCRNKKEAELFFYKTLTLSRGSASFKGKIEVRTV